MRLSVTYGSKYLKIYLNPDNKKELSYLGLKRIGDYLVDYYFKHPTLAKSYRASDLVWLTKQYCRFFVWRNSGAEEVIPKLKEILDQEGSTVPWDSSAQVGGFPIYGLPKGEIDIPRGKYSYAGLMIHHKNMTWKEYLKHVARGKYGDIPIQRNWNRMAELTKKNWPKKGTKAYAELIYRTAVQNHFSTHGKMPNDYIPVDV